MRACVLEARNDTMRKLPVLGPGEEPESQRPLKKLADEHGRQERHPAQAARTRAWGGARRPTTPEKNWRTSTEGRNDALRRPGCTRLLLSLVPCSLSGPCV
eukprot:14387374-Alexandrium_andersonii.AAC.1